MKQSLQITHTWQKFASTQRKRNNCYSRWYTATQSSNSLLTASCCKVAQPKENWWHMSSQASLYFLAVMFPPQLHCNYNKALQNKCRRINIALIPAIIPCEEFPIAIWLKTISLLYLHPFSKQNQACQTSVQPLFDICKVFLQGSFLALYLEDPSHLWLQH